MKAVTVSGVVFGAGKMKICVPLVERTAKTALSELKKIRETAADVIEWRMDYFEADCAAALPVLLAAAAPLPVLCTFRTKREGGERDILPADYFALYRSLVACGARFLDIELALFEAQPEAADLLKALHAAGGAAVLSYHNFAETPPRAELLDIFCRMRACGADLPKIAVMPKTQRDVMRLFSAMTEAAEAGPLIGISMGETGRVTRVRGGAFGSVMTFASREKASAPGQIDVETLKALL